MGLAKLLLCQIEMSPRCILKVVHPDRQSVYKMQAKVFPLGFLWFAWYTFPICLIFLFRYLLQIFSHGSIYIYMFLFNLQWKSNELKQGMNNSG